MSQVNEVTVELGADFASWQQVIDLFNRQALADGYDEVIIDDWRRLRIFVVSAATDIMFREGANASDGTPITGSREFASTGAGFKEHMTGRYLKGTNATDAVVISVSA